MQKVTIYTDGSCHGNPGAGGYAAIVFVGGAIREVRGSDFYTTNNRMELKAVIEGLRLIDRPSDVTIITDSQYVARPIERGNILSYANAPGRKNADLWQEVARLSAWHNMSSKWVRGHSGNKYNSERSYHSDYLRICHSGRAERCYRGQVALLRGIR